MTFLIRGNTDYFNFCNIISNYYMYRYINGLLLIDTILICKSNVLNIK